MSILNAYINLIKEQSSWKYRWIFLIIIAWVLAVFYFSWFHNHELLSGIWESLIQSISVITGFLLSGVSILLSNTALTDTAKDAILSNERLKNKIKRYNSPENWIKAYRKNIIIECLRQFIFSIFALISITLYTRYHNKHIHVDCVTVVLFYLSFIFLVFIWMRLLYLMNMLRWYLEHTDFYERK